MLPRSPARREGFMQHRPTVTRGIYSLGPHCPAAKRSTFLEEDFFPVRRRGRHRMGWCQLPRRTCWTGQDMDRSGQGGQVRSCLHRIGLHGSGLHRSDELTSTAFPPERSGGRGPRDLEESDDQPVPLPRSRFYTSTHSTLLRGCTFQRACQMQMPLHPASTASTVSTASTEFKRGSATVSAIG